MHDRERQNQERLDWKEALDKQLEINNYAYSDPAQAFRIISDWGLDILSKLSAGSSMEDAFEGSPQDTLLKLMSQQITLCSALLGMIHKQTHNKHHPPLDAKDLEI